jgi:hypothetical protein
MRFLHLAFNACSSIVGAEKVRAGLKVKGTMRGCFDV